MSLETASELRPWPASRWCGLILLIFSVQLGFICWLSKRTPVKPRPAVPVPVLRPLGAAPADFLALSDPTWFTLPHREGFSGRAWLTVTNPAFPTFSWPTPPALLRLPQAQPGAAFYAFVRSNDFGSAVPDAASELVLTLPEPAPLPLAQERSELRLEGGLAQRTLLTPVELESWQAADLLTNTVVRAVVDAKGWPRTVTLLERSGLVDADQKALERAAGVRFAPLPDGAEKGKAPPAFLTEGLLVFAWHTLPSTATNAAASSPQ